MECCSARSQVLCLEPQHSLRCSYLMLNNSQAKMCPVYVCTRMTWLHMVSAWDARGRWRRQLYRRVTCGRLPTDGVFWKCSGMQRWLITVNTPLSCPHADSQALHLFTPLGSRSKPGRLLQTHTRCINTQLRTNLREANMRRCKRARNPHTDVGASVCMHPNTSTLVCLIHHYDIQNVGVGRGQQEVQCGRSVFFLVFFF